MFGAHKVRAEVVGEGCVDVADCGRLEVLANDLGSVGA